MLKEGPCMHCMLKKCIFLHKIYYKNSVLEFCTSCLLALYPGTFCPICFEVYKDENSNSDPRPVHCSMCPAIAHFDCVMQTSASSSSSSSNPTFNYVCPSCSNPKFKFFDGQKDERPDLGAIDMRLAVQLVAASLISERSVREGAALCKQRAEIKAEQAAKARKEAQKALELLAELTAPNPGPESSDGENTDEEESSDEESSDEEENSEEEESSDEEEYSDTENCDEEVSSDEEEYSNKENSVEEERTKEQNSKDGTSDEES